MSLLPTERLAVALTPTQVGIAHVRTAWRRREASRETIAVALQDAGKPAWQGAVDGLTAWLADRKPRRPSTTVVLSNRYLRFALVPWTEAASGHEEDTELALACFEPRYGDMTGWTVRIDGGAYGQARIACAVETQLLDAIRASLPPHGRRGGADVAIRPAFVAGWNTGRRKLDGAWERGDGIFAMEESGTAVIATRRANGWHSVRPLATHGDDLPLLLEREALLQGFAEMPPVSTVIPGATPKGAGRDTAAVALALAEMAEAR